MKENNPIKLQKYPIGNAIHILITTSPPFTRPTAISEFCFLLPGFPGTRLLRRSSLCKLNAVMWTRLLTYFHGRHPLNYSFATNEPPMQCNPMLHSLLTNERGGRWGSYAIHTILLIEEQSALAAAASAMH